VRRDVCLWKVPTVHFYEAILAILAIVVRHLYATIVNPDVFPLNRAMTRGTLTYEEMLRDHPHDLPATSRRTDDETNDERHNTHPDLRAAGDGPPGTDERVEPDPGPAPGRGEAPEREAHGSGDPCKQMEGIKDPDKLSTEMRRHFQMTEEVLALMLERQKLLKAQAPMSGMSSGQSGGMQGGGMMGHGMGMMQKEMGGMQGGSMQGGMMQKEMGGMQGSGTQGSGTQSGGMQGSGMQGGGMQGSAMSGQQAPSSPSGSATPSSDMAQMMQRITAHSAYMETLTDQATLTQEMLRHQKMLDEMLQLMQ
jgi:hypothetical protein